MRTADPRILFAVVQEQGPRPRQEDAWSFFNDECFVLADGVGGIPHGDVAAALASETAIWAYKHIRQRPYYWEEKKRFMKRIFRTVNMTVWQKHRERGFEDGLATTLLVTMIGPKSYWVGSSGDTSAFLWQGGTMIPLTQPHRDAFGSLTSALGLARLGLVPEYATGKFAPGDTLLMATDGVSDFVTKEEMAMIMQNCGNSEVDLASACQTLVASAIAAGSSDNRTVAIVKRIAIS